MSQANGRGFSARIFTKILIYTKDAYDYDNILYFPQKFSSLFSVLSFPATFGISLFYQPFKELCEALRELSQILMSILFYLVCFGIQRCESQLLQFIYSSFNPCVKSVHFMGREKMGEKMGSSPSNCPEVGPQRRIFQVSLQPSTSKHSRSHVQEL